MGIILFALCIPVYVLASMEWSNIDPFDYKVKYEANTRYKKLYLKSTFKCTTE